VTRCRSGNDDIGQSRCLASAARAIRHHAGDAGRRHIESKNAGAVRCRTVSNHAARLALLRVARWRRDLAILSSISAVVTTDRNNEAEWASIHSTSAGTAGRDRAAAEMTLVSTRYTGRSKDRFYAGPNCRGSADPRPQVALTSGDGRRSEHGIAAPTPHSSRPQLVACRDG
jgi:hypothetical protein